MLLNPWEDVWFILKDVEPFKKMSNPLNHLNFISFKENVESFEKF